MQNRWIWSGNSSTHCYKDQDSGLGGKQQESLRQSLRVFQLDLFKESEGDVGENQDKALLESDATHVYARPH